MVQRSNVSLNTYLWHYILHVFKYLSEMYTHIVLGLAKPTIIA